jgi:hypothetical protein
MKILPVILVFLTSFNSFSQTSHEAVSIQIHDIKGYGEYENFARQSVEKLETLLNSESFISEFSKLKMTQTRGYGKTELLSIITAAKELRGDSQEKNTIDVRLRVMSLEEDGQNWMENCIIGSNAGTIGKEADASGYTVTCKERIAIWAKNESYGCMAGHIMHEYLHNLGFKHRFYSKKKSFVYNTGNLVRKMINKNNESCPTK